MTAEVIVCWRFLEGGSTLVCLLCRLLGVSAQHPNRRGFVIGYQWQARATTCSPVAWQEAKAPQKETHLLQFPISSLTFTSHKAQSMVVLVSKSHSNLRQSQWRRAKIFEVPFFFLLTPLWTAFNLPKWSSWEILRKIHSQIHFPFLHVQGGCLHQGFDIIYVYIRS